MGGINPCIRPGHCDTPGEHGERLTRSIFQAFGSFLEAHRLIESSIIAENHKNQLVAVRNADEARYAMSESLENLEESEVHLCAYSEFVEIDEAFGTAVQGLELGELLREYSAQGVLRHGQENWEAIANVVQEGGLVGGFGCLRQELDVLRSLTRESMHAFETVADRAGSFELEQAIRGNEFPFIRASQRLLSRWLDFTAMYQSFCLISLEAFAKAHKTRRPIEPAD